MEFIKKHKFIIIVNLLVLISFIIIESTPGFFGIDDAYANSYITSPNDTFMKNYYDIFWRATCWNMRFGEVIYFILGCFPRYIHLFIGGLQSIIFFNLVYLYAYGSKAKEYLYTSKYIITIITSYLLTLTVLPIFSETFIWQSGNFNHLFGLNVILIIALYFRLQQDNIDIFKKHKKLIIPYLILSFFAGFNLENVVPCILIYELLTIIQKYIKDKKKVKEYLKKYKVSIISIILTSIGFLIMFLHSSNRITFYDQPDWVSSTKVHMIRNIILSYNYFLIILVILLVIIIIKRRFKIHDLIIEIKKILTMVLFSILSLIVIYISIAYYTTRSTLFLYFALLSLLTYILNELLNKKLKAAYIIAISIIIVVIVIRTVIFYKDFDKFNELRKNYILEQYNNSSKTIICPMYDNKVYNLYPNRLTNYELYYCDVTYIKYLVNDENVWMITSNAKIR